MSERKEEMTETLNQRSVGEQTEHTNPLGVIARTVIFFVRSPFSLVAEQEVPDHMSNHYDRPADAPIQPATGLPPATKWEV